MDKDAQTFSMDVTGWRIYIAYTGDQTFSRETFAWDRIGWIWI